MTDTVADLVPDPVDATPSPDPTPDAGALEVLDDRATVARLQESINLMQTAHEVVRAELCTDLLDVSTKLQHALVFGASQQAEVARLRAMLATPAPTAKPAIESPVLRGNVKFHLASGRPPRFPRGLTPGFEALEAGELRREARARVDDGLVADLDTALAHVLRIFDEHEERIAAEIADKEAAEGRAGEAEETAKDVREERDEAREAVKLAEARAKDAEEDAFRAGAALREIAEVLGLDFDSVERSEIVTCVADLTETSDQADAWAVAAMTRVEALEDTAAQLDAKLTPFVAAWRTVAEVLRRPRQYEHTEELTRAMTAALLVTP